MCWCIHCCLVLCLLQLCVHTAVFVWSDSSDTLSFTSLCDFATIDAFSPPPATDIHNALRRVGTKFEEVPLLTTSLFVKPSSVMYQLDGEKVHWHVDFLGHIT